MKYIIEEVTINDSFESLYNTLTANVLGTGLFKIDPGTVDGKTGIIYDSVGFSVSDASGKDPVLLANKCMKAMHDALMTSTESAIRNHLILRNERAPKSLSDEIIPYKAVAEIVAVRNGNAADKGKENLPSEDSYRFRLNTELDSNSIYNDQTAEQFIEKYASQYGNQYNVFLRYTVKTNEKFFNEHQETTTQNSEIVFRNGRAEVNMPRKQYEHHKEAAEFNKLHGDKELGDFYDDLSDEEREKYYESLTAGWDTAKYARIELEWPYEYFEGMKDKYAVKHNIKDPKKVSLFDILAEMKGISRIEAKNYATQLQSEYMAKPVGERLAMIRKYNKKK